MTLLGRASTFIVWTLFAFWLGGEVEYQHRVDENWRALDRRQREIFCEQALRHALLVRCDASGLPPPMPPAVLDPKIAKRGG
jgi:hypothetical protein